jgi:hypothetical protein
VLKKSSSVYRDVNDTIIDQNAKIRVSFMAKNSCSGLISDSFLEERERGVKKEERDDK